MPLSVKGRSSPECVSVLLQLRFERKDKRRGETEQACVIGGVVRLSTNLLHPLPLLLCMLLHTHSSHPHSHPREEGAEQRGGEKGPTAGRHGEHMHTRRAGLLLMTLRPPLHPMESPRERESRARRERGHNHNCLKANVNRRCSRTREGTSSRTAYSSAVSPLL